MKKLLFLTFLFLFSCTKDEYKELYFEYNSNQPTTIVANVIVMEHSIVTFDSMEKEVNADYFHRYGIHIDLILKEGKQSLSDEVKFGNRIFLPKNKDTLTIYIVPSIYVNVSGAAAYALPGNSSVVIGDRYIRGRTLAHEIGHMYGLDHVKLENNVMTPFQGADWKERPNYFEEKQIDTILGKLSTQASKSLKMIIN